LKAIVLAAGEGTRLRPLTTSRPKVMIPVGNKPILQHVVKALVSSGIKEIVLVVGYKRERIMSYFGDGKEFGASIEYVVQERQLGTAHALRAAKGKVREDFMVVAGDNIIDSEVVSDLLHQERGMAVTVTTSETPSKYGVVRLARDKVVEIIEKPSRRISDIISTGMYRFTPAIFDYLDEGLSEGQVAITPILENNLHRIQLRAVHTTGRWMDVVYPWDLIRVNSAALELQGIDTCGTVEAGVTLKGAVSIGEGTRIRSGTYIEGPVAIGKGCDIGPLVAIHPATSIGDGVSIGPYTHILESVIMNDASISSHSHLSHCVLDEGVVLGPGLMAEAGEACTRVEQDFFDLKRIGAVIGENTSIGAGSVVMPGTIVGSGCRIAAQVKVQGNLENRSIVV